MSGIAIDSGIPVAPQFRSGCPAKYPWRQMKVGDSFVFPPAATLRKTVERASSNCVYRKQNHGESYTVRTVEEGGKRVVRVWRIA